MKKYSRGRKSWGANEATQAKDLAAGGCVQLCRWVEGAGGELKFRDCGFPYSLKHPAHSRPSVVKVEQGQPSAYTPFATSKP